MRLAGLDAAAASTSTLVGVADQARPDALVEIEADQLFENDPALRLAALLPDDQVAAVRLAER